MPIPKIYIGGYEISSPTLIANIIQNNNIIKQEETIRQSNENERISKENDRISAENIGVLKNNYRNWFYYKY